MTNLSPAAQAVLDAYMTTCGWLDGPLEDDYRCAGAVLRAAVDKVMSNEWPTIEDYNEYDQGFNFARITYRNELLDIAAELEGGND
jgi:hypothetical protein